MSKKEVKGKEVKSFTVKEVFKAMLPWAIIVLLAVTVASTAFGWFMRSDFESEVSKRVDYRLEQRELVKE